MSVGNPIATPNTIHDRAAEMRGRVIFLVSLLYSLFEASSSIGSEGNFTQIGDSQVWLSEEELSYRDARGKCHQLGSHLVEFQSENEWSEVRCKISK